MVVAIIERHFDAKQDILVEDDEEDDDVYLIRSGKATVIIGGGSEVILGEGDLIGEMSFLLGNKRTASIVAKRASGLLVCFYFRYGQSLSTRSAAISKIL